MFKLFAYGLLKSGHQFFDETLKPALISKHAAKTAGELYYLPNHGFPAMTEGKHEVFGELLEIRDDKLLKTVDAFEEYDMENPDASMYSRKEIEVMLVDGSKEKTYAYLMAKEVILRYGGWLVEDGRYK